MDVTRRKTLIKKRGIAKAKTTSIKKYIDQTDGNIDIYNIRLGLKRCNKPGTITTLSRMSSKSRMRQKGVLTQMIEKWSPNSIMSCMQQ
jgi:hypothetical protein